MLIKRIRIIDLFNVPNISTVRILKEGGGVKIILNNFNEHNFERSSPFSS